MTTKEDIERFNQIQENSKKLKECEGHAFTRIEGRHKYDFRFRCDRCGGIIDGIAHLWYQRGFSDGEKKSCKGQ